MENGEASASAGDGGRGFREAPSPVFDSAFDFLSSPSFSTSPTSLPIASTSRLSSNSHSAASTSASSSPVHRPSVSPHASAGARSAPRSSSPSSAPLRGYDSFSGTNRSSSLSPSFTSSSSLVAPSDNRRPPTSARPTWPSSAASPFLPCSHSTPCAPGSEAELLPASSSSSSPAIPSSDSFSLSLSSQPLSASRLKGVSSSRRAAASARALPSASPPSADAAAADAEGFLSVSDPRPDGEARAPLWSVGGAQLGLRGPSASSATPPSHARPRLAVESLTLAAPTESPRLPAGFGPAAAVRMEAAAASAPEARSRPTDGALRDALRSSLAASEFNSFLPPSAPPLPRARVVAGSAEERPEASAGGGSVRALFADLSEYKSEEGHATAMRRRHSVTSDDPADILVWVFVLVLMIALGSVICLVTRHWRRAMEGRRSRERSNGTAQGSPHISAPDIFAGGNSREWDPVVWHIEGSPAAASDARGEEAPGGSGILFTESGVPILGLFRIVGVPAAAEDETRRDERNRGLLAPDGGEEIDAWCSARPYATIFSAGSQELSAVVTSASQPTYTERARGLEQEAGARALAPASSASFSAGGDLPREESLLSPRHVPVTASSSSLSRDARTSPPEASAPANGAPAAGAEAAAAPAEGTGEEDREVDAVRAAAEGGPKATRPGNCAICIEDFVPSALVRVLPCGHVFHRSCIDSWFLRSSVCPLCLHDYRPESPSPSVSAPVNQEPLLHSSLVSLPSSSQLRAPPNVIAFRTAFPSAASSAVPLHPLLGASPPLVLRSSSSVRSLSRRGGAHSLQLFTQHESEAALERTHPLPAFVLPLGAHRGAGRSGRGAGRERSSAFLPGAARLEGARDTVQSTARASRSQR
ncbi:zinc finger, C3HC4 type (RING finger) domain-containing protein [Besnoitia besnoiti]|uniref:Zinc finger, C3HC4 type (RING finger) domain-containing protein n=1 Tax=Besnoitia besnoiti TaxID=94643 RepID=A0A2A9M396_BESBE|nr:zinc finger, C3HC4 type (RING finger) domain-containing protein [Besnoitia besnoiti]PFH32409.1 zinc finger, C3HC4 type (RING finger) domain-containing protein [Besnoitia besnoiti]